MIEQVALLISFLNLVFLFVRTEQINENIITCYKGLARKR